MTWIKRSFDLIMAFTLCVLLSPFLLMTMLAILVMDGRPIFFISGRMKNTTEEFSLVKFRTMTHADKNTGVSGGDKTDRITVCGKFLRKTRMDEFPQLINVILGHMSFVGPRPPLREYVEAYPELYLSVLKSRPGITGLASLVFHKREEELLGVCKSVTETDKVYRDRCIPQKAKLDIIYQKSSSICFDVKILLLTVKKVVIRRDSRG